MPKEFIKKYTPNSDTVKTHKSLKFLSRWLNDANLWHMNRRSVAGAFGVGLFWAMIPIPFQMVAAAISAIFFRINLPISVALVWLTNPITMPPIFYCNYLVGAAILHTPDLPDDFKWNMELLSTSFDIIWEPLFAGSLVVAASLSVIGYLGIRGVWRLHVINRWKTRHKK